MSSKLEFRTDPSDLLTARTLSHAAIQWPSRAARANLPARNDDGHSNLGWLNEHAALVGHPMGGQARLQLGFCFKNGSLIWLENGLVTNALALAGLDEVAIETWCDEHLASAGLATTGVAEMPYSLPPVTHQELTGAGIALQTLGAWFAATQDALELLVATYG